MTDQLDPVRKLHPALLESWNAHDAHAFAGFFINPETNAVQSLVAVERDGEWRIALFQNTPAAFHGRPEESERLTEELRQVLRDQ